MVNVWFTSDTHLGHFKIPLYAKREFCMTDSELEVARQTWAERQSGKSRWSPSPESIARMDDHIIGKINEHVAPNDILWHLGDFCFWKKSGLGGFAKEYRSRIKCKNVFLVMGNHDSEEVAEAFDGHFQYKEIKVHSKDIILSHYAYSFWNRSHYGSWMLYGHAHGSAENWLDTQMPGRLSMDVGIDNAFRVLGEYRPFSFREIAEIMANRPGFRVDKSSFTPA
jgi:calcineurin-like phosphoesterase family protein